MPLLTRKFAQNWPKAICAAICSEMICETDCGRSFRVRFSQMPIDFRSFYALIVYIINSEAYREGASGNGQFNTTHWSVVLLAGEVQNSKAGAALEQLCQSYWYPLYAYVRRKGYSSHDAQDLTQDFFARLLQKDYLRLASPERGRFRSFLLKSLDHFLINDWARGKSLKRGGDKQIISLDTETAERLYQETPADQCTPESLFDKRWALTLLDRAMKTLRSEYESSGKGDLFTQLQPYLLQEGGANAYESVGPASGLTEGAFKVAVHRLRRRFSSAVRAEVAQTVATEEEIEDEMAHLLAALRM